MHGNHYERNVQGQSELGMCFFVVVVLIIWYMRQSLKIVIYVGFSLARATQSFLKRIVIFYENYFVQIGNVLLF